MEISDIKDFNYDDFKKNMHRYADYELGVHSVDINEYNFMAMEVFECHEIDRETNKDVITYSLTFYISHLTLEQQMSLNDTFHCECIYDTQFIILSNIHHETKESCMSEIKAFKELVFSELKLRNIIE